MNTDDLIADLERQKAELGDPQDVPNTPRAMDAFYERRSWYDAKIRTLRSQSDILNEVVPKLQGLEDWYAKQEQWRQQLCDEYVAANQERRTDRNRGVLQNLELSIRTLDRGLRVLDDEPYMLATLRLGDLMRDAGYQEDAPVDNQVRGDLPWIGSMRVVEGYITTLRQARDEAQQRLDIVMRECASAASVVA